MPSFTLKKRHAVEGSPCKAVFLKLQGSWLKAVAIARVVPKDENPSGSTPEAALSPSLLILVLCLRDSNTLKNTEETFC